MTGNSGRFHHIRSPSFSCSRRSGALFDGRLPSMYAAQGILVWRSNVRSSTFTFARMGVKIAGWDASAFAKNLFDSHSVLQSGRDTPTTALNCRTEVSVSHNWRNGNLQVLEISRLLRGTNSG